MPTYDYRCPDGHEFERFYRKISDGAAEVACPTCGKTAVRVMSGGAGLVFKGSGFYLTDYGKNAHRKGGVASGGKAEDKGSEPAAAESTTKSESTPAPSSDGTKAAGTPSTDSKPAADAKKKSPKPARAPKSDD
jgi:putative FmdB family regulatory protein